MGQLVGVEKVERFINTVILTGRVAHAAPVSCILIAAPESGKTSIVLQKPCEALIHLTKTTAMGLELMLQTQPKATHIVLSDLTFVTGMSTRAVKNLFELFKPMTEEGVKATASPQGIRSYENARKGIIGCLTPKLAKDNRNWWWYHGFASRMVPFHYEYSEELVIKIKAEINRDNWRGWEPGTPLRVPEIPIRVEIPAKETREINRLAEKKAREFSARGIRLLLQFRTLARAQALMRTWKNPVVGENEIVFLKDIFNFVDWDRGAVL